METFPGMRLCNLWQSGRVALKSPSVHRIAVVKDPAFIAALSAPDKCIPLADPSFVVAWNGPPVTVWAKLHEFEIVHSKSFQYDFADTHVLSGVLESALLHIVVLSVLHPCTVHVNPVPKQPRIAYSDVSVEPVTLPRLGWVCIDEGGHTVLARTSDLDQSTLSKWRPRKTQIVAETC